MKSLLQSQYAMICDSRSVLLEYCETIRNEDFVHALERFGRGGSMRNLLAHIGNSYEGWIAKRVFKRPVNLTPYDTLNTIDEFRLFYQQVDALMEEFLNLFEEDYYRPLTIQLFEDRMITATPLQVFMHVITHEFHHKGQILSISRQLGYTPVDTDVLR